MPGKAVLYLRVSTGQQVDRGSSLPSQESACREYASRNEYEVLDVYVDEGESARTADRPMFQEMVFKAKQQGCPFNAIICYENSRFARSREDAILYKALLRKKGIDLLFTKQDFDDTPAGRLLEGIIEVVDEWYSLNLAVETKRGQKETASQGYSCGGTPPYGMKRVEVVNEHGKVKVKWAPDTETAPIVRQIYDDYASGLGQKKIAYSLNASGIKAPRGQFWTSNSLHYILFRNYHAYLGHLVFNREDNEHPGRKLKPESEWIIVKDAWEPILEQGVVDRVLSRRTHAYYPKREQDDEPYLLSGIVYCGLCGGRMRGTSVGRKRWKYYRCATNITSGKSACPQKSIPKEKLEDEVVSSIKRIFLSTKTLQGLVKIANTRNSDEHKDRTGKLKKLEKEKNLLVQKRGRLIQAIEDGIVDRKDLRDRMSDIRESIERIDMEIEGARKESTWKPFTKADVLSWQNSISSILENGTMEVIQKQINDIIERVVVRESEIEIVYRKGKYFA